LKNGNLLRQRKNPDRLCMPNTLRALNFFASLHLTIFERPANFEFFHSVYGEVKTAICCVSKKNPDRLCMPNTLRALDFFAFLHLTIFERAANFELFNSHLW
jgi:hypothetical protein